uniref:NADH-ubiquinone oxidoreductase chain 3 n=1 Tax=Lissoclinum sp. TIC-2013-079 TaxID=2010181 RepID=A0A2D1C2X2_9ASCI|nr:NADH dehydrogenase subunit 3 [Lissoclinum sp. TIC-2013-079]
MIFFFLFFFCFFLFFLGKQFFKGFNSYFFMNTMKEYECGYGELDSINYSYLYQFYFVSISYMVFDMEIVFFLPIFFSLGFVNYIFLGGMLFLFMLILGLLWEMFYNIF